MKPWLLITSDLLKTGGMDRANYALTEYLLHHKQTVHVVAHQVAPALLQHANLKFHPISKPLGSSFLGEPYLRRAGNQWAQRLADQGGPVVANGGNGLRHDINWVHYLHASHQPRSLASWWRRNKTQVAHRVYLRQEKIAFQRAQLLVANSQLTRRHLMELLHVPAERIVVLYYGIDPQRFRPPTHDRRAELRRKFGWSQRGPMVMFVGALGDHRKGFDTLFDAWQQLCLDPRWDADLVVVGQGGELAHWKQQTLRAGLEQRVHFLGFRQDVPDLLAAADALVHPARYEAYGLGVHEALCCGLPAVVSRTAGVAEQYSHEMKPLLMEDPNSATELEALLRTWREHQAGFQQSAEKLSHTLRQRTWDDMAREFVTHAEALS